MSGEVSPAMQEITLSSLVQTALNKLMPLVAPHKGRFPISDGANIVAQVEGLDGEALIYDSTSSTGLSSAPMPAPAFSKFFGGVEVGGNVDISYDHPRVALPPDCTQITLPDGTAATCDLEIYVDPGQVTDIAIITTASQPCALSVIQKGETIKLSFMDVAALTASWIMCS